MPGPAGVVVFQVVPPEDVQTTTSWWAWLAPNVPVTAKPSASAAIAVTAAVPAGTGSTDSVQVAPLFVELAANGSWRASVRSAVAAAPAFQDRGARGDGGPAVAGHVLEHRPGGTDREGQADLGPVPAVGRRP